jgi:hypothetical protein
LLYYPTLAEGWASDPHIRGDALERFLLKNPEEWKTLSRAFAEKREALERTFVEEAHAAYRSAVEEHPDFFAHHKREAAQKDAPPPARCLEKA